MPSSAPRVPDGPMRLSRIVATLHVTDIRRSVAFYRDALGFSLACPLRPP